MNAVVGLDGVSLAAIICGAVFVLMLALEPRRR
jgi:hypothetical protein